MNDEQQYPKTTDELLTGIENEWSALMDVVAKLTPPQMSAPDSGGWSPKDNLAHITEWLKILLGFYMDGRPSHEVIGVTPDVTENWDFNAINRIFFERNRSRTMEAVLSELKSVYAEVMDRLQTMSYEELLRPTPLDATLLSAVVADTYEHFAEHRETMEKALRE